MSSYLGGNAFSSTDWSRTSGTLLCTGSVKADINPAMGEGGIVAIVAVGSKCVLENLAS